MAQWEDAPEPKKWEDAPDTSKPPPSFARRVGETLIAPAEAALSLASGTVAAPASGVAGMAAAALPGEQGQGARTVERVQDALTYEPRTKLAKKTVDVVSWPFQKLAELGDKAGGATAEKSGSPALGAAVNTGIQGLPMVLAPFLKGVGPIKSAAGKNPKLAASVDAAKAEGYRLTPEEAGAGPIAKTAASLSGEPKLAKLVSKKNQELHNQFIADDLGLPKDTALDRGTLKKIRDDAGADYEAVKTTGKVTTDAQYSADLDAIVKDFDTAARDFSHRSENPFKKTLDGLRVGAFDAASAVEEVKLLRKDADKAYGSRDPGLGKAFKSAAQALDDMLDRHLERLSVTSDLSGDPAFAAVFRDYRAARTRIAKSYAAENALDEGGNINAQAYAKALSERKPLTGGARKVGEFAGAFPRSAQKPSSMPTGATAFDAVLGGLSGEWKYALARPAARELLASKLGQAFMRPKGWSATELARQIQANEGVAAGETAAGQRQ